MNIVLVGEIGRAALPSLPPGAVVHAVGWYPAHGETNRAVICHTRTEQEVAEIVSADKVIGGDPALWGGCVAPIEAFSDLKRHEEPMPKKRGRPRKVV